MPRLSYGDHVKAPVQPHLALQLEDGEVLAIPIGATIFLIEDPRRADRVWPMILSKVNHRYIDFMAYSRSAKNGRMVRFHGDWKGDYSSTIREAQTSNAPEVEVGAQTATAEERAKRESEE